jgi:hypothetical protein
MDVIDVWEGGTEKGRDLSAFADRDWIEEDCI